MRLTHTSPKPFFSLFTVHRRLNQAAIAVFLAGHHLLAFVTITEHHSRRRLKTTTLQSKLPSLQHLGSLTSIDPTPLPAVVEAPAAADARVISQDTRPRRRDSVRHRRAPRRTNSKLSLSRLPPKQSAETQSTITASRTEPRTSRLDNKFRASKRGVVSTQQVNQEPCI